MTSSITPLEYWFSIVAPHLSELSGGQHRDDVTPDPIGPTWWGYREGEKVISESGSKLNSRGIRKLHPGDALSFACGYRRLADFKQSWDSPTSRPMESFKSMPFTRGPLHFLSRTQFQRALPRRKISGEISAAQLGLASFLERWTSKEAFVKQQWASGMCDARCEVPSADRGGSSTANEQA